MSTSLTLHLRTLLFGDELLIEGCERMGGETLRGSSIDGGAGGGGGGGGTAFSTTPESPFFAAKGESVFGVGGTEMTTTVEVVVMSF